MYVYVPCLLTICSLVCAVRQPIEPLIVCLELGEPTGVGCLHIYSRYVAANHKVLYFPMACLADDGAGGFFFGGGDRWGADLLARIELISYDHYCGHALHMYIHTRAKVEAAGACIPLSPGIRNLLRIPTGAPACLGGFWVGQAPQRRDPQTAAVPRPWETLGCPRSMVFKWKQGRTSSRRPGWAGAG